MSYELYHHGILGQRWGIRRYQNPDGSLTAAGKIRYRSMSGEQMHREFKDRIQEQREKVFGKGYGSYPQLSIGENSKQLIDEEGKLLDKFLDSKENLDWEEKYVNFELGWEKKFKSGTATDADYRTYEKELEKIRSEIPKNTYTHIYPEYLSAAKGWVYANDYINNGGKELSIAYLNDLGYNRKTAEEFVEKMARYGLTLGNI